MNEVSTEVDTTKYKVQTFVKMKDRFRDRGT